MNYGLEGVEMEVMDEKKNRNKQEKLSVCYYICK